MHTYSQHGLRHVFVGPAEHLLRQPPLHSIPFSAYYFDLCSGAVGPVLSMIAAALDPGRSQPWCRVVIGFTITQGDKTSNATWFDREETVMRALADAGAARGFLHVRRVGDDPLRFLGEKGVDMMPPRNENSALTTWVVLER